MSRKYYLAYGSNLNVEQMLRRCPDAVQIGSAVVTGYVLLFRGNTWHFGVATIEPCNGESVPVGIWSISERDEQALDCYEGWPRLYEKRTFRVTVRGKAISAMAYIMTPVHKIAPPSVGYLGTIAQGYEDFGFDLGSLMAAAEDAERRIGS